MDIFVFITRTKTPQIENRLRSLLNAGIDAYVVVDELETPTKRFISFPDSFMEEIGWTHHMSQKRNRITAWDKATYFAYKSGAKFAWICEDDVYWNKPAVIKAIIKKASELNTDLIAYPLAPSYAEEPKWYHWDKANLITNQKKYWMATFNQLCRVSNRVLEQMNTLSKSRKRLFFHEAMFATLCRMYKYSVSYLTELDLPIYIEIRWDKPFTEEQIKELNHKYVLLHPVKFITKS